MATGSNSFAMPRYGRDPTPAADEACPDRAGRRPQGGLRELMAPLAHLLIRGGDARLAIDPRTGRNDYGCRPLPSAEPAGFSSSTASPISARAFQAAERARDALLQAAIPCQTERAFDLRVEAMRDELKRQLGLAASGAELIFSASGTDSQLHALFLARSRLGPTLTTIVTAADQTGSGTVHTARGHHFADRTALGARVRKGDPVDGLAAAGIALPLRDRRGNILSSDEADSGVIDAVRDTVAGGGKVLLHTMDASKLGRQVPSDRCLLEIRARWGDAVQVVVDACQMRLGRRRLRFYLDSGFMVLITGSKFFGGPPFSGALLVPSAMSEAIGRIDRIAGGIRDYMARSDWPMRWGRLRDGLPPHANFGQWLRWEAALEEIRAYHAVPGAFRRTAIERLGSGIARAIDASPSLRLLPAAPDRAGAFCRGQPQPATIFAFTVERAGRQLSLDECKDIHQRLRAHDCMIGQPVGWNDGSAAALRINIGARHVTEAWTPDPDLAARNLAARSTASRGSRRPSNPSPLSRAGDRDHMFGRQGSPSVNPREGCLPSPEQHRLEVVRIIGFRSLRGPWTNPKRKSCCSPPSNFPMTR